MRKDAHLRDSVARLRDLAERVHGLRLLLDEQVLLLSTALGAQLGKGLEPELFPVGVHRVEHFLRLGLGCSRARKEESKQQFVVSGGSENLPVFARCGLLFLSINRDLSVGR